MNLLRLAFGKRTATVGRLMLVLTVCCVAPAPLMLARSGVGQSASNAVPMYKQPNMPIETRIHDLMQRMTPEEKVRQLDLYAGAPALMSGHTDDTHAAKDAVFLPEKAEALWGNLGVGGIHDLNPTPDAVEWIQRWVIAHNRLGIPALFIEEGLHGFDSGTVFPAPHQSCSDVDPELAEQTGAAIAAEARATGVGMILAPVLDLARDPRWGRVEEDFGEDPYSHRDSWVWRTCAARRATALTPTTPSWPSRSTLPGMARPRAAPIRRPYISASASCAA